VVLGALLQCHPPPGHCCKHVIDADIAERYGSAPRWNRRARPLAGQCGLHDLTSLEGGELVVNKLFSPWWLLLLACRCRCTGSGLCRHFEPSLSCPRGRTFSADWRLAVTAEELKLTRDELEQSRLAMEDQAKTAEQQRQEQRFFDLLNVYQRTLDSKAVAQNSSSSPITSG
jgi:hypothetical protein